jgi:D-hexose-6-phosphate mutarotase
LAISTVGGAGAVLWNPGKDHTLKDLGSPDFLCVEVGVISPPKDLLPGETYEFEAGHSVELPGS